MSAIVSRTAHTWTASHRLLLALTAFAIALAATVLVVVMTSSSSSVQAPDRGQIGTQNQGRQPDNLNRVQTDLEQRCMQGMLVAC